MEKTTLKVVVLMLILAFGSLLLAQNHQNCEMNKPGMPHEKMGKAEMMKDELNLTDKQKDEIEKLRVNHRKEIIGIESEIKTRHIDKMQALQNADFAKAKSLTKEIFDREATIAQKRIDLHENIYKLLTPEQKETLKKNPRLMNGPGMCGEEMGPRGDRMGKEPRMGKEKPEMRQGHCR